MNPLQETLKLLKQNGFILAREGKNHTIYFNPKTGITVPVKRHGFNEATQRYILKEAGIQK